MKCYCCKEEVYRVNDEELCWSCDLVQTVAAILEEKHIAGETAVALAYDLHGYAVSHIIERIGEEHELSQELIRRWNWSVPHSTSVTETCHVWLVSLY